MENLANDLPDTWTPPTGRYNAGADLVDRHLPAGRGRKAAFVDPRRELSYAALAERTDRFANALRGLGLRREDRVVLLLLDTVDFPVAFWGAIKAGVVAVPINTLLSPDQWQYMIEDSRAAAVVISAELLERAGPMLARLHEARGLIVVAAGGAGDGRTVLDFDRVVAAGPAEPPGADTHADEVAFWLYTSGSTGHPEGRPPRSRQSRRHGGALRPRRGRHPGGRRRLLRGQALLRLRAWQRDVLPPGGRRHDGAPGRAADARDRAGDDGTPPADRVLRSAHALRRPAGRAGTGSGRRLGPAPGLPLGRRGPAGGVGLVAGPVGDRHPRRHRLHRDAPHVHHQPPRRRAPRNHRQAGAGVRAADRGRSRRARGPRRPWASC